VFSVKDHQLICLSSWPNLCYDFDQWSCWDVWYIASSKADIPAFVTAGRGIEFLLLPTKKYSRDQRSQAL